MKLQFERWCEANNIKGETLKLFNEGVLCYKIGAYRASFIMTYLGFQHELRNRIVTSHNKPDNIKDNYWKQIIERVQDDNSWDTEVFNTVNRTKPDNIFLIDDDIRKKYDYWRSIRNDCAHAKGEIISHPHIESFWLFIESNYNKFVINGGKAGILDKIKTHYDRRYTAPGTNVDYIVDSILPSIKIEELQILLYDIYNMFKKESTYDVFCPQNTRHDFWQGIIYSENNILRESMIDFVKKDRRLFVDFIKYYPEQLSICLSDENFARLIWTGWISDMLEKVWIDLEYFLETGDKHIGWICVRKLLEEKIIPEKEIDYFLLLVWSSTYRCAVPYNMVEFMNNYGYFKIMRDALFNKDTYRVANFMNKINFQWPVMKCIIVKLGINEEELLLLDELYKKIPYGEFHDGISDLLTNKKEFREQYIKILKKNSVEIPGELINH